MQITGKDLERFSRKVKVDKSGECWLWTASQNGDGYGYFRFPEGGQRAHRFSYIAFIGPIPAGLQIDHLCRNRACVNPAHLEAVTCGENIRRGLTGYHERSGLCPRGHLYLGNNLYVDREGKRRCRSCRRAQLATSRDKRAAQAKAAL